MTQLRDRLTSDWVQYHRIEKLGWPEEPLENFRVFWHKNVNPPRGARIWLIAGVKAKPTYHYHLIEWFLVDSITINGVNGKKTGSGKRGKYLDGRPRIDGEPWFNEFKHAMANFSRGLSPITNAAVVNGMEKVASFSSHANK